MHQKPSAVHKIKAAKKFHHPFIGASSSAGHGKSPETPLVRWHAGRQAVLRVPPRTRLSPCLPRRACVVSLRVLLKIFDFDFWASTRFPGGGKLSKLLNAGVLRRTETVPAVGM